MFHQAALVNEMERLRKFALKLTRNAHDADDLLQSTVLRALEKQHLFQDETNLFRWASKIMYNLFVSEYRRKVKFETQYDPEDSISRLSTQPSQESEMALLQVKRTMDRMSAEHRQILVMVCVKGMRYGEVSEALQIPVGTVRSRLSRARESLTTLMETPRNPHHAALGACANAGNARVAA